MSVLIAIMSLFGTAGAIVLLGTQDLGIGTAAKLAIIAPLVLLTVYCLARIPKKKEQESVHDAKSALIRLFEREKSALSERVNG